MGSSAIDSVKSKLGMGARSNKYKVIIVGKGGGPNGDIIDVLAKSAAIPGRSTNDVEVWNQGRLTTIAGGADFSGTWSVTFMDTEDHSLRGQFIAWMEYTDSVASHARGAGSHDDYMSTGTHQQLSTIDNSVKASYEFENLWPKTLSDSSMSDSTDDLVEFTVEFNYDSWKKL